MPIDYERLRNWKFADERVTYTARDTILYALGIGFGDAPNDATQLRYLLEDRLVAFPTFIATLAENSRWSKTPGTGITFSQVVHGEQSLHIHEAMAGEGTLIIRSKIAEIVDKGRGRGALVYVARYAHRASDDVLIASTTLGLFCRADGGFDGPVTRGPAPHAIPDGPCEASVDLPTSPRAALIYRLSGDYNMLHADPDVAVKAGFPSPILHGMCTYAMAGRAIVQHYGAGDASVLRALQVRFTAPVFPGETLCTEMWRRGTVVSFRTRAVERNAVVLDHGRAELKSL